MDVLILPAIVSILTASVLFAITATYFVVYRYRGTSHTFALLFFTLAIWFYMSSVSIITIMNVMSNNQHSFFENPYYICFKQLFLLMGSLVFLYTSWQTPTVKKPLREIEKFK